MFHRFLAGYIACTVLMDEAGGGKGGGGSGTGGEGGKGAGGGETDHKKEIGELRTANEALMKRLEALEGKKKTENNPADDPDLAQKAEKDRLAKEKQASDQKAIEAALKFSLGAKDWLKSNESLLPKSVASIFEQAENEKYASAIEKDGSIKSALIQEFFKVQANLDLLTDSQKSALDEFLSLTKNAKQEQAQKVYAVIFEPTFEMLKRIKKAEQLRQDGHSTATDSDEKYKDRMVMLSRKHYLGEKANA